MNTLLTDSKITMEAMMVLENKLTFTKYVRRDLDDYFGKEPKIGAVLNVRKPPRYVGRVGQALQLEDATETSVPVALNWNEHSAGSAVTTTGEAASALSSFGLAKWVMAWKIGK